MKTQLITLIIIGSLAFFAGLLVNIFYNKFTMPSVWITVSLALVGGYAVQAAIFLRKIKKQQEK